METLKVNSAAWSAPQDIPEGWVIANAPRPLGGPVTWTGEFRHGTFYAAAPEEVGGTFGWAADDAWLIEFTDNDAVAAEVLARLREYGYETIGAACDELSATVAELAEQWRLPWHEQ